MFRALTKGMMVVAVVALIGGCASGKVAEEAQYSGFLKDYSQLRQEKDASGQPVLRYISPKLSAMRAPESHPRLLIDPVVYYPAPRPTAQVSAATLGQVRDYFDRVLREKLGAVMPLTDKPGPGVVRLRVALTAVASEKAGLAPYEYIPIALVVAGAQAATGSRAGEAAVYTEMELDDSVTGERLGAAVKRGVGARVKGGESGTLTFDLVKPVLDQWAQQAADMAANLRTGQ